MRAVIMRNHQLIVDTVDDPAPGPAQAVVKTLACGICGSDLHTLKHGVRLVAAAEKTAAPFKMDLTRDVVMGHEFCAELVDFGPDCARTLKPGTRVCSMPIILGAGGLEGVGYSNVAPGGYGEYMILNEALLLEVPNGLSSERAALTEPMAVGLHAVERAAPGPDDVALVVGCGPVGLAVIAALRLEGASPIVAADYSPARRAIAAAMGADVVIDPAQVSPYQSWEQAAVPTAQHPALPQLLPGLGPDLRPGVFFECVGVPGIIDQIMDGAPHGARIVVVGVCMETDHFEPMMGINKELSLDFVLGYTPEEFAATLGHIAEGRIDVDALITGKVGLNGVAGAFEELANPEKHAKIIVDPQRE